MVPSQPGQHLSLLQTASPTTPCSSCRHLPQLRRKTYKPSSFASRRLLDPGEGMMTHGDNPRKVVATLAMKLLLWVLSSSFGPLSYLS